VALRAARRRRPSGGEGARGLPDRRKGEAALRRSAGGAPRPRGDLALSARFTAEQVAWTAGARIAVPGGPFEGVFTDSRAPVKRGLFVALRGANFDGSEFVAQAVQGGAAGARVPADAIEKVRPQAARAAPLPTPDTGGSPGHLAAGRRQPPTGAELVCTTGSPGKPSTKELKAEVHA